MAKQVLDLYMLYKLVVEKGGLVEVINKKIWREITRGLNLPTSITSAAFTLRTQWVRIIAPGGQSHGNYWAFSFKWGLNVCGATYSFYLCTDPNILTSSRIIATLPLICWERTVWDKNRTNHPKTCIVSAKRSYFSLLHTDSCALERLLIPAWWAGADQDTDLQSRWSRGQTEDHTRISFQPGCRLCDTTPEARRAAGRRGAPWRRQDKLQSKTQAWERKWT